MLCFMTPSPSSHAVRRAHEFDSRNSMPARLEVLQRFLLHRHKSFSHPTSHRRNDLSKASIIFMERLFETRHRHPPGEKAGKRRGQAKDPN